jgi:hypothetical protein
VPEYPRLKYAESPASRFTRPAVAEQGTQKQAVFYTFFQRNGKLGKPQSERIAGCFSRSASPATQLKQLG